MSILRIIMKYCFFFMVAILLSCSMGVVQHGGDKTYIYDVYSDYTLNDLEELAPKIVSSSYRDPQKGKTHDLFSKKQKPLKRIGVLVFESTIQETRSGLSGADKVYLSEQGKQLLTERLLAIWEQSFSVLGKDLEYVPTAKLKKSKFLKNYGLEVTDYVKSKRYALAPDDIFFLPPGKNTAMATVLNPRGMRDLSLALVPASDLMQGPKFSEHMKHAVNEVSQEFDLDVVLVIMSKMNWTTSHIDKHSGNILPEQVNINLQVSALIPFTDYQERLKQLGETRDLPVTTVAFRSYDSTLSIPVLLSVPDEDIDFKFIENELLNPMLKTYKDQTQMNIMRLISDLKETHP